MKSDYKKIRVVIDTNVLVSALVFGGTPRVVTELVATRTIRVLMSEEQMTELRRIITTKFPIFIPEIERYEKLLRKFAIRVPLGIFNVRVSRDPDDDKILETAHIGSAVYIISGDYDLLDMKSYGKIKILKPAEFLLELKNDS